MEVTSKRRPKVKIEIPGAEFMTPEELAKAKHNEKVRRYKLRARGVEDPGVFKKTKQELKKLDMHELVELSKDTRNLTLQILNKKLVQLDSDPDELAKVNLTTLATAFGIMFDKTQLMSGLATENIAIQAKIDITMSSDKALEELNKMREQYAGG